MTVYLLKDEDDVHDFVDRIGASALITEELCAALEQAWQFERALFVRDMGRSFQWMQVREKHVHDPRMRRTIMETESMWPPGPELKEAV